MQIEIKKLPKSEIEITGELPAEEFMKFWQKAVKELASEVRIHGFRQGNVPENILVERIGDRAVLDRAAELSVRETYYNIAEEHKLDVIGHPHVSITKIAKSSPLGFKIQTAVLPEFCLPENFKEIANKMNSQKEIIEVTQKEIEETLEQLRKMRAQKPEELPALDDEFAKIVGKFDTLDELKNAVKENLKLEKENHLKEKKRLEIMDSILKEIELSIPATLIDGEKMRMLSEFKSSLENMGLKWEDYLAHLKKTDLSAEALAKAEEEILNGWSDEAEKRCKYGLLLKKLADELKIEVSDAEIEEKIAVSRVEGDIAQERLKDYIYGIIKNEKILKFLETC
ncbi:MAG: trigger factor [Candidatus Azambacteria bacterium]|nr:trigger factor [Candidatus Azambacteria bacterium]